MIGTAANPLRRFRKKTYLMDGQPILRVLSDWTLNHHISSGVTVSAVKYATDEIKKSKAGTQMFRMCGLIFDMPHVTFPTVDQQFKALQHYAEHDPRILFDGWPDVIVQKLDPQMSHSNIAGKPCMRELFRQQHFSHVAMTSLSFITDSTSISPMMCGLAVRGRTCAVLDLGVDTLNYPDQLMGATTYMASSENMVTGRFHKMLKCLKGAFGWERVAGRLVPLMNQQKAYKEFVRIVNTRFGLDEPIPLYDYRRALADARQKQKLVPFGRSHLDAVYLLTCLGFPQEGSIPIAKAVIDVTGYKRSLGREIDLTHAKALLLKGHSREGVVMENVALRYAGLFQERILRKAQEGYVPDIMSDSVAYGMENGESREVISAKYGKRQVWRNVARTALGMVDNLKETPENRVVKEYMRRYFLKMVEKANQGIIENSLVYGFQNPAVKMIPLYKEVAKNENALDLFQKFYTAKAAAERSLNAMFQDYPDWAVSIDRDWQKFLVDSIKRTAPVVELHQDAVSAAKLQGTGMVPPDLGVAGESGIGQPDFFFGLPNDLGGDVVVAPGQDHGKGDLSVGTADHAGDDVE